MNHMVLSLLRKKRVLMISSWVLLFAFCNLFTGCAYRYTVVEKPIKSNTFKKPITPSQYWIIHTENGEYHLLSPYIENKIIIGAIEPLPENRKIYKTSNLFRVNKYDENSAFEKPTKEVHIYVKNIDLNQSNIVFIPVSGIWKIEKYKTKPTIGFVVSVSIGYLIVSTLVLMYAMNNMDVM